MPGKWLLLAAGILGSVWRFELDLSGTRLVVPDLRRQVQGPAHKQMPALRLVGARTVRATVAAVVVADFGVGRGRVGRPGREVGGPGGGMNDMPRLPRRPRAAAGTDHEVADSRSGPPTDTWRRAGTAEAAQTAAEMAPEICRGPRRPWARGAGALRHTPQQASLQHEKRHVRTCLINHISSNEYRMYTSPLSLS